MDRCPNCKATNPGTSECRRCGVELVVLLDIEAEAGHLMQQALRLLLGSDPVLIREAQSLLARSQALKHDDLVTVLQGFAASMVNDATDSGYAGVNVGLATNGESSPKRPFWSYIGML